MFPENDLDEQTLDSERERFLSAGNQETRRNTMLPLNCSISGLPVSSTPSARFSAASFTATAGLGSDVAEAMDRPRLAFKPIHTSRRRRIIIGHDLKCGGDHAVKSALVLAEQCKASIRLVHVVNPRDHFHAPTLPTGRRHVMEELVAKAGGDLEQVVASHRATPVPIDYEVRVGKPSIELILAGRAWQCDLMIIGAPARQSIHLLKSTAERLVRMAFVPVLVAREALSRRPERFLIPTDFSPAARKAAAEGVALAKCFGARVIFLHVFDPTPWYSCPYADEMVGPMMIPELQPPDLKQEWSTFLRGLSLDSLAWQTCIEEGLPGTAIVRYAEAMGADMIVMATQGKTGLEQILLGNVAEAVVRDASCPVLTLKPDACHFQVG